MAMLPFSHLFLLSLLSLCTVTSSFTPLTPLRPASSLLHPLTTAPSMNVNTETVLRSTTLPTPSPTPTIEYFRPPANKPLTVLKTRALTWLYIITVSLTMPPSIFARRLATRLRAWLTLSRAGTARLERSSIRASQRCARVARFLLPYCKLSLSLPPPPPGKDDAAEPTVWCCNHQSMLDVFILLSTSHLFLPRPCKIIYWRGSGANSPNAFLPFLGSCLTDKGGTLFLTPPSLPLSLSLSLPLFLSRETPTRARTWVTESNPVTRYVFRSCGFVPVDMVANDAGEDNGELLLQAHFLLVW